MEYNDPGSKDTFGSKFIDPHFHDSALDDQLFKQIQDELMNSCHVTNMSSVLDCTSTASYMSTRPQSAPSYNVTQSSYSYGSTPYGTLPPQPMKFSQSTASYIPTSESLIEGLNGSSGYNPSGFMVKEEPWDQHDAAMSQNSSDSKNNFVSTPLQLHFNDSPYNSPNNKSDKSSVHSPPDCLLSPFTSPSPHFTCDNSQSSSSPSPNFAVVSNEFVNSQLHSSPPAIHINGFVRIEKRGKRGRPRGSKNRSTLAKTIDPSLFPADALFPGKKRGRGSRVRGQNPGIRARVNYRAVNDYPKVMENSVHSDHANKRGSSTRGRGAMRMCKICVNCLRTDDCAECVFCKDKSKFGGSNKLKQKCLKKQCVYKGKFIEHDNPTEATSRYIVQKKLCTNPPPLSHPPLSDVFSGAPLIPTSPGLLDKPIPTPPSSYCAQGSFTLNNDHSPGFPSSSNNTHKFPFSDEPHSPFISSKSQDFMLEPGLNHLTQERPMCYVPPGDQLTNVLSPNHKSPSFNFSPRSDHFNHQPEFLQDIPVKVWMQADLAKGHTPSYD